MTRSGPIFRRARALLPLVAGTLALAACSLDLDTEPTPTPAPTAVVFGPSDVAVGALLDDSRAAWESVDAWTSETSITAPEGGTSSATTEQVILPGRQHVVTLNGDTVVSEEIVVDGDIYMRGTLVTASIYPDAAPDTWITFTPDQVPAGTVLEQRVSYLLAPPAFPFDIVTEQTRALPARPAGEVHVSGRPCLVYRFTTTTADEPGIDYRIAFDAQDRPCQLVREGGGVVETTSWSYPEQPEPIEAPDNATRVDAFPGAPD